MHSSDLLVVTTVTSQLVAVVTDKSLLNAPGVFFAVDDCRVLLKLFNGSSATCAIFVGHSSSTACLVLHRQIYSLVLWF